MAYEGAARVLHHGSWIDPAVHGVLGDPLERVTSVPIANVLVDPEPSDWRVVLAQWVPDIQTGDLLIFTAICECTNPYSYAAAMVTFLTLGDLPTTVEGIDVTDRNGRNVSAANTHHETQVQVGMYVAKANLGGKWLNLVCYSESNLADPGNVLNVEQGYGRIQVAKFRGAIVDTTAPAVPAVTATPGNQQVTIDWPDVVDKDLFRYEYRVDAGTPISTGRTSIATITGLSPVTEYDFEVRSIDEMGNTSAWSTVVSATPTGTWTPDVLSTLQAFWLAQDLNAQADASAVSAWADRKHAYSLAQATGSKQPLLHKTTSARLINGEETVTFDGVNDLLRFAAAFGQESGSVLMVVRANSLAASLVPWCMSDEAGAVNSLYGAVLTDGAMMYSQEAASTADVLLSPTGTIVAGTAYLLEWTSNGTAITMRKNGTVQSLSVFSGANNGDWTADVALADSFCVGALKRNTEALPAPIDVAEVIYLNAPMSAGERTSFNAYVTARYGLTIA